MSDPLSVARRVLASQPFSVLLGAEVSAFAAGRAERRIPVTDELLQQHGFVHGGVISYAVDNALTFAGGSALGPNVVTSEFKVNYVRPARGSALMRVLDEQFAGATYSWKRGAGRSCARPPRERSRDWGKSEIRAPPPREHTN